MKNIIVVNGEADWQEYFPGYDVHYRRIQNSSWLYHQIRYGFLTLPVVCALMPCSGE
jgi:hypothetical protein